MFVKRRQTGVSFRTLVSDMVYGVLTAAMLLPSPCRGDGPTRAEVAETLRKAVHFFYTQVSGHGGYLWRYSGDLTLREAEGQAGTDEGGPPNPAHPSGGAGPQLGEDR